MIAQVLESLKMLFLSHHFSTNRIGSQCLIVTQSTFTNVMSFIFSRRNGKSRSGSEIAKNEALGCEDDGTDYIFSIKHLD